MDESWDNLIILDACRYDMFSELNHLPGELESRRSKGSATKEFVKNNFVDQCFPDTVYVSANPYVSQLASESFHHVEDVWKDGWSDECGTVLPEVMTDVSKRINKRFPDKRLILHYMQPHHPFLGSTAEQELNNVSGNKHARQEVLNDSNMNEPNHIWARTDEFGLGVIKKAYYETLDRVLESVGDVLGDMVGKSVITSDHGNLLDEPPYNRLSFHSRRFGHPMHGTAKALVKVPWLICPHDTRKTVSDGDVGERDKQTGERELVDERLESLGYK